MTNQYHYDSVTGEYIGQSACESDQFSGKPLISAFATTDAPPDSQSGYVSVWQNDAWKQIGDLRGFYWNTETGEQVEHTKFGPLPSYLTKSAKPGLHYIWFGGVWVEDLDGIKADRVLSLKRAVEEAIVSGVYSDILGSNHFYPTTLIDQANLNGLVTNALFKGSVDQYKVWCLDGAGIWARRSHTKAQIQALFKLVNSRIHDMQSLYESKLLEISSAMNEAEILAVNW